MRLLHTSELELEDFGPSVIPRYAILSHRWGKEEVTFEDMIKGLAQTKTGYSKIAGSCKQANNDGYEYIWVDTCCINKDSSAELSEAINSMYAWYKNAGICYAYLVDVPDEVNPKEDAKFAGSDWFNRGWTLQELLAPHEVVFFSTGWTRLGKKSTLCSTLSRVTRIGNEVLSGKTPMESLSVAKRMSWASRRKTSRLEDIAYCLMGLFDVNMPMLYGEGKKAFLRLQEEIMKDSDDESLFAWINEEASPNSLHGLLAESPAWFNHSGDIETTGGSLSDPPFSKTNKGLRICSRISPRRGGYVLTLSCARTEDLLSLNIYLRQTYGHEEYARVMTNEFHWQNIFTRPTGLEQYARATINELLWKDHFKLTPIDPQSLYVRQDLRAAQCRPVHLRSILHLRSWPSVQDGYNIHKIAYYSTSGTWETPQIKQIHALKMVTWNHSLVLPNEDRTVFLILVVQRVGTETCFAILFATSPGQGITFDACNCHDPKSGDFGKFTWSSRFRLPGDVTWTGSELVRVHALPNVRDACEPLSPQGPRVPQTHYMVDIETSCRSIEKSSPRFLYQDAVPD